MQCPIALLMRAADARADAAIGAFLGLARESLGRSLLDDRALVWILLLHERARGVRSRWHGYIKSLPGDELVRSLPLHWTQVQLAWLSGTPLHEQARSSRDALQGFYDHVVVGCLRTHWPAAFPAEVFSWEALCWAHAIFWSRALTVELDGLREECLVPAIDLCNHRPGSAHELSVRRMATLPAVDGGGDRVAPAVSKRGLFYVLTAGRSIAEGDEVRINYGAKGNGELLRAHGFVLPHNDADVHEIQLGNLGEQEHGVYQERLELLASVGLQRRHFLFAGGLPPTLLSSVRVLCASTHDELQAVRTALSPTPDSAAGGGSSGWDWSAVDWEADDPFGKCGGEDASPLPPAAEARAMAALLTRIGSLLAMVPTNRARHEDGEGGGSAAEQGSDAYCKFAAGEYCRGQRVVLEYARDAIASCRDAARSAARKHECSAPAATDGTPPIRFRGRDNIAAGGANDRDDEVVLRKRPRQRDDAS